MPIMLTVIVVLNLALIVRRLQVRKRAGTILFRGRQEKMHWILWADLITSFRKLATLVMSKKTSVQVCHLTCQ
ncbi:hypothetical protein [Paenibacillus medicaginis]|uniref:Secreted protein n=1 Tax=Paenibacillus medicaginis TaxID=1470560 RepID=A0ABV5BXC9_9BACL